MFLNVTLVEEKVKYIIYSIGLFLRSVYVDVSGVSERRSWAGVTIYEYLTYVFDS